ncbi:bifunctional ADP-dependent NAD(P)H-hydrate dehydratase/NAD(P)H-hydrate epimerase [Halopseudomonas sabulinigri]|uniref:Bifunctional NAD(P)H-hydrate repair enzyme n=2 Tax=Halopseudomonas sabulinigri TaxID=472181 RepID=A0ABP9ZN50_9GAMM
MHGASRIIVPDIDAWSLFMPYVLPDRVYTAAQVRELDARLIAAGTPGIELMQRAAEALWQVVQQRWPHQRQMTVLCGGGNNAGDGYLLAKLALQAGWQVVVWAVADPQTLQGDAASALQAARADGVDIQRWHGQALLAGVLVDALLGTGLSGEVRGDYVDAIAQINAASGPVLSVDLPSGLDADRGVTLGCAVIADLTVTFIGLKLGLLTGEGPDYSGELLFAALADGEAADPSFERLSMARWAKTLPVRKQAAHKGHFGHLLIVGGGQGMGGAIMLAAEAALCSGAGKISVATRPEHVAPLLSRCPELMVRGIDGVAQLQGLLEQADALVIGPGLGRDSWAQALLDAALEWQGPRVLDADALNLLAERAAPVTLGADTVISPHPAEAARLLAWDNARVQSDRPAALARLVDLLGCSVILKGAGSLVASTDAALPAVCTDGNPGMAVGGMGDVLSGLLGALLAQRIPAARAARYAVLVHALAGESAASGGQVGMRASDMFIPIKALLNQREAE